MTAIKKKLDAHIFEREAADHYVEPLDVGVAMFRHLDLAPGTVVLDPCCGWGRILRAAQEAGLHPLGCDIFSRWDWSPDGPFLPMGINSYPPAFKIADWFDPKWCPAISPYWQHPTVIASNPPYDRADEFLELALKRATTMVALILPATWHHGAARSLRLEKTPLYQILPITPRPSMPPGQAILDGQKVGGGTKDFSLFVFLKGYRGAPQGGWLRRKP